MRCRVHTNVSERCSKSGAGDLGWGDYLNGHDRGRGHEAACVGGSERFVHEPVECTMLGLQPDQVYGDM